MRNWVQAKDPEYNWQILRRVAPTQKAFNLAISSNCRNGLVTYSSALKANKLAISAYTIPAFTWRELYNLIDINRDIARRVAWMPDTTVGQIKKFDEVWFLKKYPREA